MAFDRHPEGRQPIGVAQQPFPCYDYPLVPPVPSDIQYLIADLKLVYDDPGMYSPDVATFKYPFKIAYLRGLGTIMDTPLAPGQQAPRAECRIVDADDRNVINTVGGVLHTYPVGGRLMLYVWQQGRNTLYLVAHTHWPDDNTFPPAQEYNFEITPTNAIIDARATIPAPQVVRSLSALNLGLVNGDFQFVAGYNYLIDVEQETSTLRQKNRLIMSAIPGAGFGVFQDCDQEGLAIHSLSTSVPTADGKFFLKADDCTWVRQPIIDTQFGRALRSNSLQIGDNCKPCCDCVDYARTAINLYRLQQKYKDIGNNLHNIRKEYHKAVKKWKDKLALTPQFNIELRLIPQYCPQMDVYVQFNNGTDVPVNGATFRLHIEADGVAQFVNPPIVVGTYLQMFMRPSPEEPPRYMNNNFFSGNNNAIPSILNDYPDYVFDIVYIGPRESAHAKFRLEFQDCLPKSVTGQLQASVEGLPVVDSENSPVIKTQTVYICGATPPDEEDA